jgi:Protein of unknown function (DUF3122)
MRFEKLVGIFRLILIGLLVLVVLLWATPTSESAIAVVVQLEDSPQQTLYRSQQRLSDRSGKTWQVIFFKQVQHHQPESAVSVSLRLVGLPGSAEVNHPHPLILTTTSGQTFSAADVFLDESPAPTIAQYDMRELALHFPAESLRLTIPVLDQTAIDLEVPLTVIQEWQEVIDR